MPNYKDALSGLRQFLATKSHLKPMNNAFYFPLFPYKFFSNFLVNYKNALIRKISLISKLVTSQLEKQTIGIQILPNK